MQNWVQTKVNLSIGLKPDFESSISFSLNL